MFGTWISYLEVEVDDGGGGVAGEDGCQASYRNLMLRVNIRKSETSGHLDRETSGQFSVVLVATKQVQ